MVVVVFKINGNLYALDIKYVHEVIARQRIVPIPDASAFVAGMTNVRGRLYTCVDLCNVLFNVRSTWSESQLFLLTSNGEDNVSFIIDGIETVKEFDDSSCITKRIFGSKTEIYNSYIYYNEKMVLLLNVEKLYELSDLRS